MPHIKLQALARAAASLLVAAALTGPAAAEERCYGDWSDAAPIVSQEGLRSLRDVQHLARHRHSGDVVRIVLCETGNRFVYRVVLRHADGRIANLTVDAAGR